jgi:DNA-binding HxlR family transcriptional regulator
MSELYDQHDATTSTRIGPAPPDAGPEDGPVDEPFTTPSPAGDRPRDSSEGGLTYGQYCPITKAVEVLGERWSLLILRDLLIGNTRFNELARGAPGLSRSLLSKRLRQFERAGLVEHVDDRYLLTPAGHDLMPVVMALGEWGAKWAFGEPEEVELDAQLLVWWMHRRFDPNALPDDRTVFELAFADDPRRFWIVVEPVGPSVCLSDPGFETDVLIRTDRRTMYEVWMGRLPVDAALRRSRLAFEGRRELTRRMGDLLQLSEVAPMVAAAMGDRT